MKVQVQAIPLSDVQHSERLVKRGALLLFRGIRAVAAQAAKAPGVLAQASADVKAAWVESSDSSSRREQSSLPNA